VRVRGVSRGEFADVDDFCRVVWPRLASSLGLYCHDISVGEELAQEALARAWARWDRVSRLESPAGWVYRVGLNLAKSRFRRVRAEQRAYARVTPPAAAEVLGAADAVAVRDAVAALPERQPIAIILRYFADLPATTVAEVMDCAPATVRSLTSQAIERLRAEFRVDAVALSEDAR
jgi:RNA polymerase sigma factor (sigma-70 family)